MTKNHYIRDSRVVQDLRQLDRLRAVMEAALDIRAGHYSVKHTLDAEDRTVFDRFNQAVDAWMFGDWERPL